MIKVYFDGSCPARSEDGVTAYAFLVYREKVLLHKGKRGFVFGPPSSHNVAEYAGLIGALEYLIEQGMTEEEIIVHGDSSLVLNQMFGTWALKSGLYFSFAQKALKLLMKFSNISGEWVPREFNTFADSLSAQAFKEAKESYGQTKKG